MKYSQLQRTLKLARDLGMQVNVKLNSSKYLLNREYYRLFGGLEGIIIVFDYESKRIQYVSSESDSILLSIS